MRRETGGDDGQSNERSEECPDAAPTRPRAMPESRGYARGSGRVTGNGQAKLLLGHRLQRTATPLARCLFGYRVVSVRLFAFFRIRHRLGYLRRVSHIR
jgi:hypothetical protein